jgi:HEAT repeat protein
VGSAEAARFVESAQAALFPQAKLANPREDGLQSWAQTLLDSTKPLKIRRQAAWNLAKLRSAEAFVALRQGLAGAPQHLKATIAELLGNFDTAESRQLLRELLNGSDETVARGAMRGWAALGDAEAFDVLSKYFANGQKPVELRADAALNLSRISSARANQVLVESLGKMTDRTLAAAVLTGLAEHAFAESEPFFRQYLGRTDVPVALRVAALEALGEANGNPMPLLLQQLESADSDIRAASAWAIGMLDNPAPVAPDLLRILADEKSSEVRTRLYQALENQSGVDAQALLSSVLSDPAASRVAGLKFLAAQTARLNDPDFASTFDRLAVPELENLAMGGGDLQNKLASVMALKQARTPGSLQALARVAAKSSEPRIATAARVK